MRHRAFLWSVPAAALLVAGCVDPKPALFGPRTVVVESPQPLTGPSHGEALPGSVHARVEADLSFRVSGKIAERKVDMGARVLSGTVLAVLDPQDAQLNLEAARAAVAAAAADVELARAEEQRYRDLRARGFVGQSQLDIQVNTTQLAVARHEQAQAQFNLSRNQSRYTRLTADAPGVVTEIMAEPGNVVAAGQPVLRFAADGEREVHVNVPEGRVDAVRAAATLQIRLLSQPDRLYGGRIRDINPQADHATRTHLARVTIVDADTAVQLGTTATVIIGAVGDGRSFRLPATALGTLGEKQAAVWRVMAGDQGETVEAVAVEVLQYFDGAVAVSGPLSTDDRLVTAGVHSLVAGMPVAAIARAAKAAL